MLVLTACANQPAPPKANINTTLSDDAIFPAPPELQPQIAFWRNVYAVWGRDQVALHDTRHLDLIYAVLTLPGPVGESQTPEQQAFVKGRLEILKANLQQLESKVAADAPLTPAEQALAARIQSSSGGSSASNLITNSDDAGVWITTTAGTGNLVRPNQIFDNGKSGVGMGIDIGVLGQSVNDPLDPDTGANNGQNWPQITASVPNPDGTREVTVTLDSKPNTNFRIDIYRAPDCPAGNRGGNMLNRVGGFAATTNGAGQSSTTVTVNGGGSPGLLVATATNQVTHDSSEPGLCFIEPAATTTTITNDSPDASQFGQPYTVTVLVSSLTGTPSAERPAGSFPRRVQGRMAAQ